MFLGATKTRVVVTAAIAAMWLTACGGGGGDDVAAAPEPPAQGGGNNPPPATAALGTSFRATGPSDVWHSLSSSANGQLMVAGQADLRATPDTSILSISRDGGATWSDSTAPTGIWIASDISDDGNIIAATQFMGSLYVSIDAGANFVQASAPPGTTAPVAFESVTLARLPNGTNRVAAVVLDGPVVVGDIGADGTVTWLTPTTPAPIAEWRGIDSSANGSVMVAVAQDPLVYRSTDGGLTWAAMTQPAADQGWYRVKVSNDGSTIAMAANSFRTATNPGLPASPGNGIYVSKGGGAFVQAHQLEGEYSSIAMSSDGGVIGATVSDTNDPAGTGTGSVLLSKDGGTTFAPLTVNVNGSTVAETDWRALTMSNDATRMAVAAGRFVTSSPGQIYLTTGSRP
jgi:hypothetical protein